jgi:hypothetical protein
VISNPELQPTIPALCDFRSAAMSFSFASSAPVPFRLAGDFYASSMIFDASGKELGTALNAAMAKWNDGGFPSEVGDHLDLAIFETRTVHVDSQGGAPEGCARRCENSQWVARKDRNRLAQRKWISEMMSREAAEEYTQSLGQIGSGFWRQIVWADKEGVPGGPWVVT